jgi:hypothetical protein
MLKEIIEYCNVLIFFSFCFFFFSLLTTYNFVNKINQTGKGELICARGSETYTKIKSLAVFLNKLQIEIQA